MMDDGTSWVVLGIGNLLLGDDGVGVHVVRELQRRVRAGEALLPSGARLVDGGTRGADLAPFLAGARAAIVVDALDDGGIPGTIAVLDGAAIDGMTAPAGARAEEAGGWPGSAVRPAADGLRGLLATMRVAGATPGEVSLVGIRPAVLDVGLELSRPVEAALPEAADAVLEELTRLVRTAPTMTSRPGQAAVAAAEAAA
jgi:hydrogenase maturation protease